MKSTRNKTLDMSVEEGREYLLRCISPTSPVGAEDVLDKTILGDSFQIMPLLPRAFADLVIADPPYNLRRDFDGGVFKEMSSREYEDYTRSYLELVRPLLKDNGSIYVCCDWRCSCAVQRALEEFFTVRSRITWQREKGRGAARNWKNSMEDVWFATVSDDYTFNLDAVKQRRRVIAPYKADGKPKDWQETENGKFRDTCPSNFWDDITVPYWSMAENTAHPTQKPEKLLSKLILASSNPGDVVFDPFLGSGSTSVTAKKLGRHYSGIERSEQFCVWCEKRLERADTDKTIQGFSDGVFWERNSGK
jgi:site-specific DNA-methyltransferase (adenine-specific)